MDEHEIPIQTSVLGDDFMEYQSKNPAVSDLLCYLKLCKMPGWAQNLRAVMQITIRWRVQIPKKKYFDKFQAPSTSTKKWNGWHFKRWDSGIRYVGEWEDGLPHGKGKYYGIDGGSYEGDWARGVIHGKGTFLFANGDTYSGQWRLGFRHGHGRSVGSVPAHEERYAVILLAKLTSSAGVVSALGQRGRILIGHHGSYRLVHCSGPTIKNHVS